MRLTISQNVLHFDMKCSKVRRWGAYGAPPNSLVGRGFLSSAIAASRLRRLHYFPDSHVYMRNTIQFPPSQSPPPRHLQHLNFFTSNMSHYLKSLKICPASTSYHLHA